MSDLTKEAAYFKGLLDGMKLDSSKDETKLFSAIAAFMEKAAEQIEMLDDEQGFIADEIDGIEEAIEDIAEELSEDIDDDLYQIKCENCGYDVVFSEDEIDEIIEAGIDCPNCGELVKLDLGDLDDCDCGCGCDHNH